MTSKNRSHLFPTAEEDLKNAIHLGEVEYARDQVNSPAYRLAFDDAEFQFSKAGEYIASVLGSRPSLFAYPYGTASDYVVNRYLPDYQSRHKYRAAFTTEPKAVSKTDNRWLLPRFVCGQDWRSPGEFKGLLESI